MSLLFAVTRESFICDGMDEDCDDIIDEDCQLQLRGGLRALPAVGAAGPQGEKLRLQSQTLGRGTSSNNAFTIRTLTLVPRGGP